MVVGVAAGASPAAERAGAPAPTHVIAPDPDGASAIVTHDFGKGRMMAIDTLLQVQSK